MSRKKHKPPYLPTWILDDFLNKIRLVNVPAVLNAETLRGWGIAPNQEHFLTSALNYLNLVDDEGKPTPELAQIQIQGEPFKAKLREIVQKAYEHLFVSVDVEQADLETLVNFFGMNYSQATKLRMVKCFVYLWRLAGGECPAAEELERKAPTPADKVTQKVRRVISRSSRNRAKAEESQPPPKSNDKLLRVFEMMADWDANKMKLFFDNFDKVKEMIGEQEKEKTEGSSNGNDT
jgi:hypothetical protein